MGRVHEGGRNVEGQAKIKNQCMWKLKFGAERYLAGEAAFETIVGMQNTGIQAWYTVPLHFEKLYKLLPVRGEIFPI